MTPGEILAYATGLGTLGVSLFTLYGKGRENAWTQGEKIRSELQAQINELREREAQKAKELQDVQQRLAGLEAQLSRTNLDKRILLDFLKDIIGGNFDMIWIADRAQDLLSRLDDKTTP